MSGPKVDYAKLREQEMASLAEARGRRLKVADKIQKMINQIDSCLGGDVDLMLQDLQIGPSCKKIQELQAKMPRKKIDKLVEHAKGAQNFAKENVGWADPSVMQSYYSAGTMIALIVTALLTRKIKDVRFILVYPVICLATMVVVLVGQTKPLMIAGAFIIGWAGAGGLLQIVTSVCNMLFPKIKGTVTALVMIASSLCNYTILTAASKMQPSQVMVMNIVLTAIGVVLGLFVNLRYTKMVELSKED